MIGIVEGLGIAKTAVELTKAVREALRNKKLTQEEMRDYLDTLQDKLIDVKTSLADADDENRELKQKVRELENKLAEREFLKENYEFRNSMIWRKGSNKEPYCSICFERDGILTHLTQMSPSDYYCVIHKQTF
jgi:cell shape-determining protein MreC